MSADASMSLGVVVEPREIDNPWQDYVWRPIAVISNAARGKRWRELQRAPDWVHFLAATFDLELFRGETEGYMTNLSQNPPLVYVVSHQGEEAEDLVDEFTKLFYGMGQGSEILHYASYYLTGSLHDRALAESRRDMDRLGIARGNVNNEPEDHAAAATVAIGP